MTINTKQAIRGRMPADEVPAFLRSVGIYALQAQAGYIPPKATFEDETVTKSVLACDDSYEAEQVLHKIFAQYYEPSGTIFGECVGIHFDTEYLASKHIELMDAVVKSPHRFMRDILEQEYRLPLLRRNMTDEQKHIADVLEARFKQDETLRLEGKIRCHYTGVITVVTDAMLERRKQVSRLSQLEINKGIKVKVNES